MSLCGKRTSIWLWICTLQLWNFSLTIWRLPCTCPRPCSGKKTTSLVVSYFRSLCTSTRMTCVFPTTWRRCCIAVPVTPSVFKSARFISHSVQSTTWKLQSNFSPKSWVFTMSIRTICPMYSWSQSGKLFSKLKCCGFNSLKWRSGSIMKSLTLTRSFRTQSIISLRIVSASTSRSCSRSLRSSASKKLINANRHSKKSRNRRSA